MSEGVDALFAAEGFAGYGRWVRLLEIVAFKMDKTSRCHAEYSIQKWCSLLGLKRKKLISFLELTEDKLKTKVVYSEDAIRIEIPNLLKKRDNYTSDLEVNPKQLPSKEVEVEVDKEEDKDYIAKNGKLSGKPDDMVLEVITYLNSTADLNYRSSGKETIRLIKAREKEGYILEDFRAVIDSRTAQWKTDPKMSQYLRPQTLFGTKFEAYLNEARKDRVMSIEDRMREMESQIFGASGLNNPKKSEAAIENREARAKNNNVFGVLSEYGSDRGGFREASSPPRDTFNLLGIPATSRAGLLAEVDQQIDFSREGFSEDFSADEVYDF